MSAVLDAWVWVLLLGVLLGFVVLGVLFTRSKQPSTHVPSDPERCLEVMLARGQISTEEYHRRRSELGAGGVSGRFYNRDASDVGDESR